MLHNYYCYLSANKQTVIKPTFYSTFDSIVAHEMKFNSRRVGTCHTIRCVDLITCTIFLHTLFCIMCDVLVRVYIVQHKIWLYFDSQTKWCVVELWCSRCTAAMSNCAQNRKHTNWLNTKIMYVCCCGGGGCCCCCCYCRCYWLLCMRNTKLTIHFSIA